jgi:hypothetical protein
MTAIIDAFNMWKRYESEYKTGIFIIEPAYVISVGRTVLIVLLQNPVNPVWSGIPKEEDHLKDVGVDGRIYVNVDFEEVGYGIWFTGYPTYKSGSDSWQGKDTFFQC